MNLFSCSFRDEPVTPKTSLNHYIYRKDFPSHGQIRAWFEAQTPHGVARSREIEFNTADISK